MFGGRDNTLKHTQKPPKNHITAATATLKRFPHVTQKPLSLFYHLFSLAAFEKVVRLSRFYSRALSSSLPFLFLSSPPPSLAVLNTWLPQTHRYAADTASPPAPPSLPRPLSGRLLLSQSGEFDGFGEDVVIDEIAEAE